MEMTSNCDVINNAHQKQITTIWPWTKPPPWKFSAYATGHNRVPEVAVADVRHICLVVQLRKGVQGRSVLRLLVVRNSEPFRPPAYGFKLVVLSTFRKRWGLKKQGESYTTTSQQCLITFRFIILSPRTEANFVNKYCVPVFCQFPCSDHFGFGKWLTQLLSPSHRKQKYTSTLATTTKNIGLTK